MVEAGITTVVGRSCGDSRHGPSSRSFPLTLLNEALDGLMAELLLNLLEWLELSGMVGAFPSLSLRVLAPSLWGMCIKEDC